MSISNIFTVACSDVLFNSRGQLSIVNIIEGIEIPKGYENRFVDLFIVMKFFKQNLTSDNDTINLKVLIRHENDHEPTDLLIGENGKLPVKSQSEEFWGQFAAYVKVNIELPKDGKYFLLIKDADSDKELSSYNIFVKTER